MKDIMGMMKQVQQMQSKMQDMQNELAEMEIEGQSGGGLVTVTLNGKSEMRSVKIDPSLAVPDEVEILEDLIVAATQDAKASGARCERGRTPSELKREEFPNRRLKSNCWVVGGGVSRRN